MGVHGSSAMDVDAGDGELRMENEGGNPSDFVSIQFCCNKWRLYEATGNDLSVTDFVGDSSPDRGAKGRQSVGLAPPSRGAVSH